MTSGVAGVLEGRSFDPGDALCGPHHPLESLLWAVQLPYQEVIQPDRMLSIVHLKVSEGFRGQATFISSS